MSFHVLLTSFFSASNYLTSPIHEQQIDQTEGKMFDKLKKKLHHHKKKSHAADAPVSTKERYVVLLRKAHIFI